jgi:hypothetical protein
MTIQEKELHYDTSVELRRTVGGWFGIADYIYAGHKLDEDRAKEAIKKAVKAKFTLTEFLEIPLGYLYTKECGKVHIDEQLKRIRKKIGSKLT